MRDFQIIYNKAFGDCPFAVRYKTLLRWKYWQGSTFGFTERSHIICFETKEKARVAWVARNRPCPRPSIEIVDTGSL